MNLIELDFDIKNSYLFRSTIYRNMEAKKWKRKKRKLKEKK